MAQTMKIKIRYYDLNCQEKVIRETMVDPNSRLMDLSTEYPSFEAAPGVRLFKNGFPLIPSTHTLTELGILADDEIEVRNFIRLYFRDPTLTKGAIPYWMWTGEDVGFTTKRFMEYLRPHYFDYLPPDPHFHFPGLGWLDHYNKMWYRMGVRHNDSVYIENWGPNNERVPDKQWARGDLLRAPPKPANDVTFEVFAQAFSAIYACYRSDWVFPIFE